jgi:hypothetical protein
LGEAEVTDRVLLVASITALLVALSSFMYAARAADYELPRCDHDCRERVEKREAREKWRAAVRAYGIGTLRARMRCESGSHGGYEYVTNGLFWFAHQFEPRAWAAAGGRLRNGRPVGVWSMQPERLEQDVRAVYWDEIHPGDPWPNCP